MGLAGTPVQKSAFAFLKASLKKMGHLRVRIVSGSMLPVIQVGQEVDLKPVDYSELRRFMPIVFHADDDHLVCHFVWHLNYLDNQDAERVILTRGIPLFGSAYKDNIDIPVPESLVLGQVCNVVIPWWLRLWIILFKS